MVDRAAVNSGETYRYFIHLYKDETAIVELEI